MNLKQRFSEWKKYQKLRSSDSKLVLYLKRQYVRHARFLGDREDDLVFLVIFGMLVLHAWGKGLPPSFNEGLWFVCLGLAVILSLLRLARILGR